MYLKFSISVVSKIQFSQRGRQQSVNYEKCLLCPHPRCTSDVCLSGILDEIINNIHNTKGTVIQGEPNYLRNYMTNYIGLVKLAIMCVSSC